MKWPHRLTLSAVLLLFLSASPFPAGFDRPDWRRPDREWASGPIWYLMTTGEYDDYRRLRGDEDRRAFIREFWRRRDPLPDTTENELEREFWHRVSLVDDHFGQGVKPGWKTEKGKLFVLLGPPLNTEEDRLLEDHWSTNRWVYDLTPMPPVLRAILQQSLQVPADRDRVEIRVQEDPEGLRAVAGSVVTESTVLRPTGSLKIADALEHGIPGAGAMKYLGLLMRVPEAVESARLRVNVSTLFSMVPVEARVDFRPSPGKDTTVAVTLGVPEAGREMESEPGEVILSGYLSSADGRTTHHLTGAFGADPRPEPAATGSIPKRVFQAVKRVPPGRYLLHAAYRNTETRVMGSVRDYIEVPPYDGGGLTASSLVLSSRLELLEPKYGSRGLQHDVKDLPEPFLIGGYRVIPRTTPVYPQRTELTIFYEVYGAHTGNDGRPHFDLQYQFFLEDSGAVLPLGPPIVTRNTRESAQAWRVPLRGWPPGDYRLEVSITDTLSRRTVVRGTAFRIGTAAPNSPLSGNPPG